MGLLANEQPWPELPLDAWRDTYETLHLYSQVVGKYRLAVSPWMNHWWHAALYVTARGLTTSPLPYGDRTFDIDFDFIDHVLVIQTSEGERRKLELDRHRSVAEFYFEVKHLLLDLDIEIPIYPVPVEIPHPVPFAKDDVHDAYDHARVGQFFAVLHRVDIVFKEFRGRFAGKASPVHFWWGGFDLATSRFSGRWVPPRKDADSINREAYNAEVSSLGFWPGSGSVQDAAFYSYIWPEPQGFKERRMRPESAYYDETLKAFVLRYDEVREAENPEEALLDFAQSTYETAATLANWDRENLEYPHPFPRDTVQVEEEPEPAIPSPT